MNVTNRKLFVGGLARKTTDNELLKYFVQFGELVSAEVLRDHHTMSSRGFGFVTFYEEIGASNAFCYSLTKPHIIDGKQVDVKMAVPKQDPVQISSGKSRRGSVMTDFGSSSEYSLQGFGSIPRLNTSLNMNDSYGDVFEQNVFKIDQSPTSVSTCSLESNIKFQRCNSLPLSFESAGTPTVANKMFVGGLLYSTGHERLRNFFTKFGEITSAEVIYNRETKKSRGFGFIIFKYAGSLESVMIDQKQKSFVLDGKVVEVKRCKPKQNLQEERSKSDSISVLDELARVVSSVPCFDTRNLSKRRNTCFEPLMNNYKRSEYTFFDVFSYEEKTRENYDFEYDFQGQLPSILEY